MLVEVTREKLVGEERGFPTFPTPFTLNRLTNVKNLKNLFFPEDLSTQSNI